MKMLPSVLNVFYDYALMVEHFVAVFLFATLGNRQHLLVGQAFVFHRIDADVMQRLGAAGIAGYHPHIMKSIIKVFGAWVAEFYKARLLVLALLFHIFSSRPIAASDVAFYYQDSLRPSAKACLTVLCAAKRDRASRASVESPCSGETIPAFRCLAI